jgi:3-deoxy-D-manno-octulosonic-acid transferase
LHTTSALYKLLLLALSPIALAHVVYRSLKDGGWRYFKQRLGFGYTPDHTQPIHIHCASVGEFITAKPLIESIHAKYPDKHLIITTNTPTAASLVKKLNYINFTHHYFPIDLPLSVNNFLERIHPQCTIILETELWPTYYYYAAKKHIPIIIVSARLSDKTSSANKIIKKEYSRTLKNVKLLLARSAEDHDKFLLLGAPTQNTHFIGNLKYTSSPITNQELACTTIKRPFFLAASTHENEETQLCEHLELLRRKKYLLVIAPRYPDRCGALAQQFRNKGLNVAIRSKSDTTTDATDIYIIDTLGELNAFFNEAALVFIGGSLISRGGHNTLEPAKFGKCIIVGPHTENFMLETAELLKANALIQVKDNHQLGINLIALLKDDKKRESYGKKAKQFMNKQDDILNNYLEHLKPFLEKTK